MNEKKPLPAGLLKLVLVRFFMAVIVFALLFFWPAGTFDYWQAWVYLAVLFFPMMGVGLYLLRNDPELLERRMRTRERVREQKWIVSLALIPFLLAFILPGFDQRFGWSHMPPWAALLADAIVLLGYGIVFLVFRENRYASRVVEVAQDQQVIQSGPYAVVRHPMYVGSLLLYIFSPIALGSWWAVIPALLIIPVLVARARNEEVVLARDLKGYTEYMQKVRYRMLPGIW